MQALTFRIGMDRYAVEIRRVCEVIPRVELQSTAGTREWFPGVFVYRGAIVPVIDLHRLVGVGDCPKHLSSRLILIESGSGTSTPKMALLAAGVDAIEDVPSPDLATHLTHSRGELGPLIVEGQRVIRWLDLKQVERLFDAIEES
jgi:chemotaxis-related protein WspB